MRRKWAIGGLAAVVAVGLGLGLGLSLTGGPATGRSGSPGPSTPYQPTPTPGPGRPAQYQAAGKVAEGFTKAYLSYDTRTETRARAIAKAEAYTTGAAESQVKQEYPPQVWSRLKAVGQRAAASVPVAGPTSATAPPPTAPGLPHAIVFGVATTVDTTWRGGHSSRPVNLDVALTCHRLACKVAYVFPNPKVGG